MNIDKLLVASIGSLLIVFIWWFFFGKKETELIKDKLKNKVSGKTRIDITVDGGYKPDVIYLQKGIKSTLNIIRKDSNTCLEDIILPDFKVRKYLPLNKKVEIEIVPESKGEFSFHCGMNMFHGKLIIY